MVIGSYNRLGLIISKRLRASFLVGKQTRNIEREREIVRIMWRVHNQFARHFGLESCILVGRHLKNHKHGSRGIFLSSDIAFASRFLLSTVRQCNFKKSVYKLYFKN